MPGALLHSDEIDQARDGGGRRGENRSGRVAPFWENPPESDAPPPTGDDPPRSFEDLDKIPF